MTQHNDRSLYSRTIASGGGTFEMHAENFNRADITSGYAVGMVQGTFALAPVNDARIFNYGIARAIEQYPNADAIGTWIDGESIHIDPVQVFTSFDDALAAAIERKQLAFFNLSTGETYGVDYYIRMGRL